MKQIELGPRSSYFALPDSERLLSEAADARTVRVSTSVKIGYVLLNRHLIGDEAPIVAVGGFMSDVTTPDRAWEGVNLAALQRPVLMLDMPGHGESTPHSPRQIIDLCVRRSADSQAEPLTEAVQKLLSPEDPIDYFGISHGALLSFKMAQQDPSDRVRTVFGIDLPAVKRRSTLGLQVGYMVLDNILGRKEYLKALADTPHEADFNRFKALFEAQDVVSAASFLRNNPGLFALNLFASINARPVALDAWLAILKEKSARLHVVTSADGSVSDPDAIARFIEQLPDDQRTRSSQTIVPGEDHNIGITHLMPRAAAWARDAFDSKI